VGYLILILKAVLAACLIALLALSIFGIFGVLYAVEYANEINQNWRGKALRQPRISRQTRR